MGHLAIGKALYKRKTVAGNGCYDFPGKRSDYRSRRKHPLRERMSSHPNRQRRTRPAGAVAMAPPAEVGVFIEERPAAPALLATPERAPHPALRFAIARC